MLRSLLTGAAAALLCMSAQSAVANPWDLYGFNPSAMGMGGAHTAAAVDFTNVYYNPAALTASRDATFGFGYTLAAPQLSFSFDNDERSTPELQPPSADGITFGGSFPLSGTKTRSRVGFGFAINVPTSSLLDGQAVDPATPHWYMFHALPRRIVAALGLGIAPFDFVSIGLGFQILAGVSGRLDYELDVVAGRYTRKSVQFDIEPRASPTLGIEFQPLKGFRAGFSFRGSIDSDVELPVNLELTGLAELEVFTTFRVQYTPAQFNFGASYVLEEFDLKLSADFTFARWSRAPDPSVTSAIDVGGRLFEESGFDAALDAPAPGQERSVDLGFRDVLVSRFGAEKSFDWLTVRGGYNLRPSPAPLQSSGTNYIDATTHGFALGVGARFRDPIGVLANPLLVDFGGSWMFVPRRRYQKIDPRDPIGSYSVSGSIFVMSFSLRYEFGEAVAGERADSELAAASFAP